MRKLLLGIVAVVSVALVNITLQAGYKKDYRGDQTGGKCGILALIRPGFIYKGGFGFFPRRPFGIEF